MKTKFIWIALAVAVVVILFTNRESVAAQVSKFTDFESGGSGSSGGSGKAGASSGTPGVSTGGIDYDLLLSAGSRGVEVKKLQELLNMAGWTPPLVVDGIFGIKTTNALKNYNSGSASITLREAYQKILNKAGGGLF